MLNPKFETSAYAEAPALRKASEGGASRRQANFEAILNVQFQMSQRGEFRELEF